MLKRVLRLLVAAVITPVLVSQPAAFAQDATPVMAPAPFPLLSSCDPIVPTRERPGYSDDAATLRQNAIDILTATLIDNETWSQTLAPAEGAVFVAQGSIRSDAVIARVPVRHAQVGRTEADAVAIPVFRERFVILSAGAEVWKTHFITENYCEREHIQMWCGPRRPASAVRHELQCFMPPESHWLGIAQALGNEHFPVAFRKFIEDAEAPRVTPLESITAPAMEIQLIFDRWRGDTASVAAYVAVEGDDENTLVPDVADVRSDPRGTIVSVWGGELLLQRGGDRNSATVEVLTPINQFDPQWQANRLRERATVRVDEEIARRNARAARR